MTMYYCSNGHMFSGVSFCPRCGGRPTSSDEDKGYHEETPLGQQIDGEDEIDTGVEPDEDGRTEDNEDDNEYE